MSAQTPSIEQLWSYCTANQRVVPMPQEWNKLYQMLKNKKRPSEGERKPPLPLILGAWHYTTEYEKQERLKVHLNWAEQQNQLTEVSSFLRGLTEDCWLHFHEA